MNYKITKNIIFYRHWNAELTNVARVVSISFFPFNAVGDGPILGKDEEVKVIWIISSATLTNHTQIGQKPKKDSNRPIPDPAAMARAMAPHLYLYLEITEEVK